MSHSHPIEQVGLVDPNVYKDAAAQRQKKRKMGREKTALKVDRGR